MPGVTPFYGWRIPNADGTDFIIPDDVRLPVTSIDSALKNEENLRTNNDANISAGITADKVAMDAAYNGFGITITAPGAFSLGNATVYAKYKDYAHTRHIFVEIVRGSTTNLGTGDYTFTFTGLPSASAKAGVLGSGMFFDSSPFKEYPCLVRGISTHAFVLVTTSTNDRVSNTIPVVPAVGDAYVMDITYELAP
jgi:hypothetical protein